MPAAERPILFSAPMVRARLAGMKTQTRRVVKPWEGPAISKGAPVPADLQYLPDFTCYRATCPYGRPGDRLWVRETYFAFGRWETRFSEKKGRDEWHFVDMTLETGRGYLFEAPEDWKRRQRASGGATPAWWKRPAIFMPRAASRITLEITEVRVQRLQDISEADAIAEGIAELVPQPNRGEGLTPAALCLAAAATVEAMPRTTRRGFLAGGLAASIGFAASPSRPWEVVPARWTRPPTAQQVYAVLWESINGPGSWAANPWVWSISFRRVTP